jgi:hypothetical protein
MIREWVGTGRTAELCLPIPPVVTVHAAFTAHGGPLRGTFTGLSALQASARIPKPSHLAGLLRTPLSRCGPSPCGRLSRPPTTMATLTSSSRLRGFLGLFPTPYFRSRSHRLKDLPSSQRWTLRDHLGGSYPGNLYLLSQAPERMQGTPGLPASFFGWLITHKPLRNAELSNPSSASLADPSGKVLSRGRLSP